MFVIYLSVSRNSTAAAKSTHLFAFAHVFMLAMRATTRNMLQIYTMTTAGATCRASFCDRHQVIKQIATSTERQQTKKKHIPNSLKIALQLPPFIRLVSRTIHHVLAAAPHCSYAAPPHPLSLQIYPTSASSRWRRLVW